MGRWVQRGVVGCRLNKVVGGGRGSLGRWGASKDLEEVSCGFRCKFWGWPDFRFCQSK